MVVGMRPDRLYLEDVLTAAAAIAGFIDGRDAKSFAADDMAVPPLRERVAAILAALPD
jgi:uncharacterized protein with HEPN domain